MVSFKALLLFNSTQSLTETLAVTRGAIFNPLTPKWYPGGWIETVEIAFFHHAWWYNL